MRIFLRKVLMIGKKINWQEPISEDLNKEWNKIVSVLVTAPPVVFQRRARPYDVAGPPELISFSDGSNSAHCAVIYLRWPVSFEESGPWNAVYGQKRRWSSHIILSKSCVNPLAGISIPRAEANGLLVAFKLINVCLRALIETVEICRVRFLIDSECLLAAMRSEHGHLAPYLANRRAQMIEYKDVWSEKYPGVRVDDPVHVSGHRNISDLGTRGLAAPQDVGEGTEWQNGPAFMETEFSSWPVSEDAASKVPDEELLPRFRQVREVHVNLSVSKSTHHILETLHRAMDYSDSFSKVQRIVALMLRASNSSKMNGWNKDDHYDEINDNLHEPLSSDELKKARRICFLLTQPEVSRMLQNPPPSKKKKRNTKILQDSLSPRRINMQSLCPYKSNGIWITKKEGSEKN